MLANQASKYTLNSVTANSEVVTLIALTLLKLKLIWGSKRDLCCQRTNQKDTLTVKIFKNGPLIWKNGSKSGPLTLFLLSSMRRLFIFWVTSPGSRQTDWFHWKLKVRDKERFNLVRRICIAKKKKKKPITPFLHSSNCYTQSWIAIWLNLQCDTGLIIN